MIKVTVTASKFREQLAHYLGMVTGKNAVQIVHRGEVIRLLITQEHYLDLLSRLAIHETDEKVKLVPHESAVVMQKRLVKKLQRLERHGEIVKHSNRVGKSRKRTA
jgi:hypothetical protein